MAIDKCGSPLKPPLKGTDEEKHSAFLKAREEIKGYFKSFVETHNLV